MEQWKQKISQKLGARMLEPVFKKHRRHVIHVQDVDPGVLYKVLTCMLNFITQQKMTETKFG